MLAVVLRAIVIMPAIPPVIAPTVSVSSPRFTAVKTASLYVVVWKIHHKTASNVSITYPDDLTLDAGIESIFPEKIFANADCILSSV